MKKITIGNIIIEIRKTDEDINADTFGNRSPDVVDDEIRIEDEPPSATPSEEEIITEIAPIEIPQGETQPVVKVEAKENASFDRILSKSLDTIRYYDQLATQTPMQEIKTILDDVCRKQIENLILSGCTPIDEPQGLFDMNRHKTVPYQMVPEGTAFTRLVRPGIEYNGEVKLLAIVEL